MDTSSRRRHHLSALVLAAAASGCIGEIGGAGDTPIEPHGGLPNGSTPAKFACTDPAARGTGNDFLRRLSKDELLQSFASLVGTEVMASDAVVQAAASIPAETTGDVVHEYQNGHHVEHVRGLFYTAEAIANAVAGDAAVRDEVLGACASEADSACAEAFLAGVAPRVLKRPLDDLRRQALLGDFAGQGGLEGMKRLLMRLLQSPEVVFHLEPLRVECTTSGAAAPTSFAWNDEGVFFAPNGGAQSGPQQQLTASGWYVWQIEGDRVPSDYQRLVLALSATNAGAAPVRVDVNVDDAPVLVGVDLADGAQELTADIALAAGDSIKVGIYFSNGDDGNVLEVSSIRLEASGGAETCAAAEPDGDRVGIDDHAVAARIAYAITGTAPDALLLEAADAGELQTLEQARAHAVRLMDAPEARRQLGAVLDAWLDLHAVPDPYVFIAERAGIDGAGLGEEARQELLEYVTWQVLDRESLVPDLMTERVGFPRSERLAQLYGTEVVSGDDPVQLEQGHGGLLLRLAPLLSGQRGSSPILRGVYVRKRLLCDELPSPDFTIVQERTEELEHSDPVKMSTREIVTEITSPETCQACHVKINPIGFAMEGFGPLAEPRDEEIVVGPEGQELARHPIDTSSHDPNIEDGGPTVLDGSDDLNLALSSSGKVYACIAERLYTHGRMRPMVDADGCALSEVETALRQGLSVKEAWVRAVVNEDLFWRKAEVAK
jgi:hypothetical protein